MQDLKEDMKAQLKELDELISKSNKNLLKLKNIPDKGISVSKSNGYDQYYWVDRVSGKRTYAKADELNILRLIFLKNTMFPKSKKSICICQKPDKSSYLPLLIQKKYL